MKHADLWRPSKFVQTSRGLRASDDPAVVSRGSRFVGDLVATVYARAITEHARGALLDVGCGAVPLYGVYRDYVTDNVCVDWAHAPDPTHLDAVCDLNESLPFPDAAFDTILATDVLEHLRHPDVLWSEIARLLRPSGKLILGVPFLYWLHEEPHDYARYTEHKLRSWCLEHGLDVLELEPYGGAAEVLTDLTGKALLRSTLLSDVHLGLARLASKTRLWSALSGASARRFPLGYLLVAQTRALSVGSSREPP